MRGIGEEVYYMDSKDKKIITDGIMIVLCFLGVITMMMLLHKALYG